MIKFSFKDKTSWTADNGQVTNWTNYAIKYKDDRVQPVFMAPSVIQDTWNGKEFDIQHERADYYSCEVTVKESEKHSLSKILSCSEISLIDFEMNNSGTVINQTYAVDTTKSDNIQIEEIESNIGQTSGGKYRITFRTNRTIINKCLPVDNTNYVTLTTTFYTDYDILDYSRQTEPVYVDWSDGKRRLARYVDKSGKQALIYLTTANHDNFIKELKALSSIDINGTTVKEIEYEDTEIAEGIHKIIISGISSSTDTEFNLSPLGTYVLSMNSGSDTYSTDYPVYSSVREPENITVEWDDGTEKLMQNITKITREFSFFLDSGDTVSLTENLNKFDDVTYGGDNLTEFVINKTELYFDMFRVDVSGVIDVNVNTVYTFPTSGTALVITDTNPTAYTFYTDFDVRLIPESADKNVVRSQTGVNATSKSITKQVKQVRFYLNETNAFNLKAKCELFKPGWTCTLAGSTVYEITNSDNITPTLLDGAVGIYEVIVNCLMTVTTN